MKTVLVFAGTTEGRELIKILDRSNVKCHACVATEYGSQILKTTDNVIVHTGRLDEANMQKLMENIGCNLVVDATHPYAVLVTAIIKKCVEKLGITYIRLLRENTCGSSDSEKCTYDSAKQCAEALKGTSGTILLTTGSKELKEFVAVPGLKERLVVRVIPGLESLKLCHDAGLEGKQIIAMQGPFSYEMNVAIIKEYDIKHLVTKESGSVGGVYEKVTAALDQGANIHMIKRPDKVREDELETGKSMSETIQLLEDELRINLDRGKVKVSLVGIGPGSSNMMTKEVELAIKEADVVFGAQRMLESFECKAQKYPYYLKDDILPILSDIDKKRCFDTKVVILFSGDTGFYSGCKKMYEAVKNINDYEVRILPGISSISVLCSRLGDDWQDGQIISLHGVDYENWSDRMLASIRDNEKTFFITSGAEDIRLLGKLLVNENCNCEVSLGYQLSYPEESVMTITPQECTHIAKEGLYVGRIVSEKVAMMNRSEERYRRNCGGEKEKGKQVLK